MKNKIMLWCIAALSITTWGCSNETPIDSFDQESRSEQNTLLYSQTTNLLYEEATRQAHIQFSPMRMSKYQKAVAGTMWKWVLAQEILPDGTLSEKYDPTMGDGTGGTDLLMFDERSMKQFVFTPRFGPGHTHVYATYPLDESNPNFPTFGKGVIPLWINADGQLVLLWERFGYYTQYNSYLDCIFYLEQVPESERSYYEENYEDIRDLPNN